MHHPYGGQLIHSVLEGDEFEALEKQGESEPIILHENDIIHLVNIGCGALSPLDGFMNEERYLSVLFRDRLENGLNWTVPILLHVEVNQAGQAKPGTWKVLKDNTGKTVGMINVEDVFSINSKEYAQKIYNTTDRSHPGARLFFHKPACCIGGKVVVKKGAVPQPGYYTPPVEHRNLIAARSFDTITAFSTRNVCHIGHEYLHCFALESTDALGINVITGAQVDGSIRPEIIFETYEMLARRYYPYDRILFNNLRIPPIYAGPREAFLQATILQNYGYTHFIVGRDHAGVGDYYGKYASQQIFETLNSLDILILAISEPRFCLECDKVTTEKSCPHNGSSVVGLNGREVRKWIQGDDKPFLKRVLRKELRDYFDHRLNSDKLNNQETLDREMGKIFFKISS